MAIEVMPIMPQICDWLRANGIVPGNVPIRAVPKIADGQITVTVFRTNAAGKHYVDPATKDIARGSVTVPLKVEPPAALREWLGFAAGSQETPQ